MSSVSFASAAATAAPPAAAPASRAADRVQEGFAIVCGVTSGDSLILLGSTGAALQKQLTLNGLVVPKLSRSRTTADEAGAFQAKETLRKLAIGQRVFFRVLYTTEGGRCYGTCQLDANKRDLSELMVESGWATVKLKETANGEKVSRPEQEAILALQERAKSLQLGVHAPKGVFTRKVHWAVDAFAFFEANKQLPLPAVVDGVRDGSTIRAEFLGSSGLMKGCAPSDNFMLVVHMAGVQCPRVAFPEPDSEKTQRESEPFAMEAQAFTETRLLSRDVNIVLLGIDKSGNLFGEVRFSKGNIAMKLLEVGLAKYVPWSGALLPSCEQMKTAESVAKQAELKVWSKAQAKRSGAAHRLKSDFQGKITQCLSGDSFMLMDPDEPTKEIRISLASIKCPRLGRRGEANEPLAMEAREFCRSRLIGHKVRIVVEYSRHLPSDPMDAPIRPFVSVFLAKQNLSELLLLAGLATLIKHRTDEDRSQFYEQLIQAEKQALSEEKGVHGKNLKPSRIVDLSERPRGDKKAQAGEEKAAAPAAGPAGKSKALSAKSKQFLAFFQRDSNVQAVVEYLFSATRVKLYVPKESLLMSFALAGVKVPPSTQSKTGENYGQHALEWLKPRLLQHSVRAEFEMLDRGDNFIGSLFVGKLNVALELVREGLAQTIHYSASKLAFSSELFQAEKEAKEAGKGLWATLIEEVKAADGKGDDGDRKDDQTREGGQFWDARVTEIESANEFYIQFRDDANSEAIAAALKLEEQGQLPRELLQAGEYYAGQFNGDEENWYRVRLESISGDEGSEEFRVFYLDYGNYDVLDICQLRALPDSIKRLKPLAHRCTLSCIKAPLDEEYREGSALAFNELVWGLDVQVRVDHEEWGAAKHVTICREENGQEPTVDQSVNAHLLRAGWVKLLNRVQSKLSSLRESLKEHEAFALRMHFNCWEYGDISDEETEAAEKEKERRAAKNRRNK